MEFVSPISTTRPLAPINDQNLKRGGPVFLLFILIFEIRFPDALLATEVIFLSFLDAFIHVNSVLLVYSSSEDAFSGETVVTIVHWRSRNFCFISITKMVRNKVKVNKYLKNCEI